MRDYCVRGRGQSSIISYYRELGNWNILFADREIIAKGA